MPTVGKVESFLKDSRVQTFLESNNLFEVYTLFEEEISAPRGMYPSELTEFLIKNNINPFDYMDTIIEGMYAGTDVKEVTVPGTIKKIPLDTFYQCTKLTKVTFEEGVEELAEEAFIDCWGLNEIVLPKSIKYIRSTSFLSCGEFMVKCYEGTYAHKWAEMYGAHVVLI